MGKNGANQRAHSWHAIVLPYNTVDTYHNSMLCLASPLQRAALDQETGHAEPRISQGYGLSSMHGPEQVMLLGHASDNERVYTRLGFFVALSFTARAGCHRAKERNLAR